MLRIFYATLGSIGALLVLVGPILAQRDAERRRPNGRAAESPSRSAEARADRAPKLIEWGYDQPRTSQLRTSIAEMEKAPFDGVVFSAFAWDGARRIDMYQQSFGREGITKDECKQAIADLKATHFKKFTDNFLRLNVTPGDVDWFDDAGWAGIVKTGESASWICKEGGVKGIMFDTEQYVKRIFYYQNQPEKGKHSFEEYRDQARKRGREYGEALTSEKKDITIMFTFATSFMTLEEKAPAPYSIYGLLPAFIDGMMDGAHQDATFVDALEEAYPVKDRSRFEELHRIVGEAKKHSMDPRQYSNRMTVGFGIWLDKDYSKLGWDPDKTDKNYFQPDEFQKALESALAVSDKYVWVYTERVNWWTGKGMSDKYRQAADNARASTHR